MREERVSIGLKDQENEISITYVHTLVLGSGAAGLNAAVQLSLNGVKDVLILTEGLLMGTSINTGSDKQTYYKLSMCGGEADSPRDMAETYFANGAMHGDIALIESSLSVRSFINLVNLGIPFPRDEYGQFVGYKTDHDPRQRATSIGPYTSREMCRSLIEQVKSLGIPVRENRNAVEIVKLAGKDQACGLLVITDEGDLEAYVYENLIFAVGGPGGLYQASVYPPVHTGAIGLGLMAGAAANNLPESQYGLASLKFRWNVSGTYMQVIPRIISRAEDGISDEKEFLPGYFDSPGEMNGMVFLKGYQWPFDAKKVIGGSSIVDILVYIETVIKKRRVYLDFREDSQGFEFSSLPDEAYQYLKRSEALLPSPIERLEKMNPQAIALYRDHNIDLYTEALEVGVCAQHNNGGLAGTIWWESSNIKHLFPIGEVNGSHGITRPGGSALNAGQVAGFRAAEYIAHRYHDWSVSESEATDAVKIAASSAVKWIDRCEDSPMSWGEEQKILRDRMTQAGAHIRSKDGIKKAVEAASLQFRAIAEKGLQFKSPKQLKFAFRVRQLCFAHAVYLDAIQFVVEENVGSRGSSIILDSNGTMVHEKLDENWRIAPEDTQFRSQVLETYFKDNGEVKHRWIPCRPIPEHEAWFETAWARFRDGDIYDSE